MTRHNRQAGPDWLRFAIYLILGLTFLRVIGLYLAPVALYQDETQYWVWSREFDFGYFSKPPMIAWLIALSTSVFGDGDAAVRLPAPLLHAGTASFLFLTARHVWDARTGFWAAATYMTLPAIWISGGIISTDALLLCAWSAALYCLVRLRESVIWPFAIGLGVAIGLGFLSKYAMIYFVVGLGIAVLFDAATRKAMLSLRGLAVAAIAILLVLPNILWNAANDFATVTHTAANANWGGDLFHPDEMFEFISAQLGVFGPLLFVTLIGAIFLILRHFREADRTQLLLVFFILPPILTVSVQAFISRAHANWAAATYVAATLLVVGFVLHVKPRFKFVLPVSAILHTAFAVFIFALIASPALTEATGLSNATKRIRAWDETADRITAAGMAGDYSAVVFDDRNVFHQMQRYAPDLERDLRMWWRFSGPVNHAEQGWPLEDGHAGEILIVSHRSLEVARMREDFAMFESAGAISIALDGDKTRDFTLWRASGYQRVVRDAAYEERWLAVDAAAGSY